MMFAFVYVAFLATVVLRAAALELRDDLLRGSIDVAQLEVQVPERSDNGASLPPPCDWHRRILHTANTDAQTRRPARLASLKFRGRAVCFYLFYCSFLFHIFRLVVAIAQRSAAARAPRFQSARVVRLQ